MIKSEIQLFILWSNARNKENEIIKDISENLKILEIYEIEWSKKLFLQNLTRFYCEKIRTKIKHTGKGKFLLITVLDETPDYGYCETLKGYEFVNKKMLSMKKHYRKITNGGYKVHSTNDIKEVNHNLTMLIGKSYDDYFKENSNKTYNGEFIKLKRDLTGTDNWKSLNELFYTLNNTVNYVIYRSFEDITDDLFSNHSGDIDILTDNSNTLKYIANAKVKRKKPYNYIIVNNKKIDFDIAETGDDIFCLKWEEDLLDKRIKNENNMYVLQDREYLYSLLYHGYFHKKSFPEKYVKKIEILSGGKISNENFTDKAILNLKNYMDENDYYPVKPKTRKIKYFDKWLNIEKWIKILEKNNFSNIKNILTERQSSSGFDYYFKADLKNISCFVKCGTGEGREAEKEYKSLLKLNKLYSEYFPNPILYKKLNENEVILAIEFINGKTLSKELINKSSFEQKINMFNSIYNIAQILFKNKFIHRDFNCDNLMVLEDGTIKLIDFQHILGHGFEEEKLNLQYPKKLRGTNKHLRPQPYTFDDMYSAYFILKMFDDNNKNEIPEYSEKINNIKSKIGKLRNYFLRNKFPFKAYLNYKFFIFYKIYGYIQKPLYKLKKIIIK